MKRSRLRRLVTRLSSRPHSGDVSPDAAVSERPNPVNPPPTTRSTWFSPTTLAAASPESSPTTAATCQVPQLSYLRGTPSSTLSTPHAFSPGRYCLTRDALIQKLLLAFQSHEGGANRELKEVEAWLASRSTRRRRRSSSSCVPPEEELEPNLNQAPKSFGGPNSISYRDHCLFEALELSRDVIDEERHKFCTLNQKMVDNNNNQYSATTKATRSGSLTRRRLETFLTSVREEPCNLEPTTSPSLACLRPQSARALLTKRRAGAGHDLSVGFSFNEERLIHRLEDQHLRRLLKLHRHRPHRKRTVAVAADAESAMIVRGPLAPASLNLRSASCPPFDVDCSNSTPTRTNDVVMEADTHVINFPNLRLELPPRGTELDFSEYGYEWLNFLAEGSLGQLHLVRSEGRVWVAKCVDLASFGNPVEAGEALLEAELLRRLRHSNIVEYKESFLTSSSLVIVMEYCELGDLHSYLIGLRERNHLLEESQIHRWVRDVASGLDYMHTHKVLHCDVKSSNIFLDNNLIGDLGIARELRGGSISLSPTRCPRGTPVYMSPEMCKRAALTERTDCWSLGCIIYELCHLSHAFPSQLGLGQHRRSRSEKKPTTMFSEKKSTASSKSVSSISSFMPGITGRSDMSQLGLEMLGNIRYDLKRLRAKHGEEVNLAALSSKLPFWRKASKAAVGAESKLFLPQVLPPSYSPLLNYLVCAMLEPQPDDRPSLKAIIAILSSVCPDSSSGLVM